MQKSKLPARHDFVRRSRARQFKIQNLRKKYPRFIYNDFSYQIKNNNLEISFNFSIEQDIKFQPKIIIENISQKLLVSNINSLDNLVFHLGLIEIPSYWKATCSPIIEIRAGFLNSEQTKWWKDLIIKGMGQFFYENKIDWRPKSFLKIETFLEGPSLPAFDKKLKNRYLVPMGGGKDSIVTLESLKEQGKKIGCFLVNPTKVMRKIVKVAGIKDSIVVKREIDPTLLELNKRGFLNGHTPITAVYSFWSVLAAVLFNYKNIAFSNEKSANEGNLRYLGKIINHQWSKSCEFEKKFRYYCQKYLAKSVNYFSFLRKYTELETAKMFTKYPQYFSIFSSCNVVLAPYRVAKGDSGAGLAKKLKRRWCGNCPKCLFVYATLYPFLKRKQLLKIFGTDIFENKKLLPAMKSLIGQGSHKPFECVGTFKENKMAFQMSLKETKKIGKVPWLLTKLK